MLNQFLTVYRHRPLILSLVSRELKARYRGNILGFLWSVVNPLLLLLVYVIVFSVILPMGRPQSVEPYALFFFCGLLPWTWFQGSLTEASGTLLAGGNLIRKVLFPAEVLPVVSVAANLVHFALGLPILFAFLIIYGKLTPVALLLPLPMLVQLILTLGFSFFLSALTLHFRDVQNILVHVLHLLFFASPVLYLYSDLSGRLKAALRFNPMTHILVSYQEMLFQGEFHHWRGLALTALLSLAVLAVGAFFFDRLRDTFPETV